MLRRCLAITLVAGLSATIVTDAYAGALRDRIMERVAERKAAQGGDAEGGASEVGSRFAGLGGDEGMLEGIGAGGGLGARGGRGNPPTCEKLNGMVNKKAGKASSASLYGPKPDYESVAYGNAPLQTLDVFTSKREGRDTRRERSAPSPIIVMVHGGAWCIGDKGLAKVTSNKVAHWTPKGFTFVSLNYPMIMDGSDAIAQANDVARAVAYVQANAAQWGADGRRVILMGHSAGAHLVSLVNASSQIRRANGMRSVLGTVSLDAGATNVVNQMEVVFPFLKGVYQEAFGTTESSWVAASPYHQLDRAAAPWLGVCSLKRKDDPCGQGDALAKKSQGVGVNASTLPLNKSHGQINEELGKDPQYTAAVDRFMASLDPVVAALLR